MQRIAGFEKVSEKQFIADWCNTFGVNISEAEDIYKNIKLPLRATAGSAGYDFFAPADFCLDAGQSIKIPTGIRARITEGWVLQCYPRSGLGFKFRLQLDNTVGIIDSDYYYSDNEGHIFCKLTNDSKQQKTVTVLAQQGFAQGVFIPFGITWDDNITAMRNGGFGSTTQK